jgi:hypothetical protein
MTVIDARGLRKLLARQSRSTESICGLQRVALSDSSVPTAQARVPRSTRFLASPRIRENCRCWDATLDGARSTHARRLFHCRCCRPAALVSSLQPLDYVAGVHPRFNRAKAEGFLAKTSIRPTSKVRELSKGM